MVAPDGKCLFLVSLEMALLNAHSLFSIVGNLDSHVHTRHNFVWTHSLPEHIVCKQIAFMFTSLVSPSFGWLAGRMVVSGGGENNTHLSFLLHYFHSVHIVLVFSSCVFAFG